MFWSLMLVLCRVLVQRTDGENESESGSESDGKAGRTILLGKA